MTRTVDAVYIHIPGKRFFAVADVCFLSGQRSCFKPARHRHGFYSGTGFKRIRNAEILPQFIQQIQLLLLVLTGQFLFRKIL